MNTAAEAAMDLSTDDHVKPALKQLHWLPVKYRVVYKLRLLMHYVHIGRTPQYLTNCVTMDSTSGSRYGLRSSDTADYV